MADKTSNPDLTDYIQRIAQEHVTTPDAPVLRPLETASPTGLAVPAPSQPALVTAPASPVPAVATAALEPAPSTLPAPAPPERWDLAYFTTPAKEATKKQSVYLPVELHRALTTVVNLPGVEVSLTDLLANIVQAWRDDHRAEVRKRYRDGEKSI
jgi:hypothetical protein